MQIAQTSVQDFINTIPDSEKHEIIQSYQELEQNGGFIGKSVIRTYTEKYLAEIHNPSAPFALIAYAVAFECYRYFYEKTVLSVLANLPQN